ncbi:glucose uptake inhibitor SgrT [Candidatus Regiella insecticola]|uniref:Inhibitor of glucose uptake transporter SgrT n=1 Tax=Candidatus Regiella insecticola TaxID=138073 RepID=A0A6L2ZN39_9ENTR|nr:inhibitor of glucose uptake transporter SgrT [Candidatus Regiella insecticola]
MKAYLSRPFYKNYFYANRQVDWLPWVSTDWRLKTLAQLIQWDAPQK